jgi:hypothetical protein
MRMQSARTASLALALLAGLATIGRAQKSRGLEWGGDAGFFHYAFNLPGGLSSSSTSLSFPISSVRVAFPTDGPFEPEVAANLGYSSSGGRTATGFSGELGLLTELSPPQGPRWFVRPAIGWQVAASSGANTTSRATLGAGVGVRVGITDRIAARYEARYTYLSAARGVSANVIGLLAGISVFTR